MKEMINLFVDLYTEPQFSWSTEVVSEVLTECLNSEIPLSFVAEMDGEVVGGIFARTEPFCTGRYVFVESLQIKRDWQGKGVGKVLMKTFMDECKNQNLNGIRFLADDRKPFPKEWYEKLGFLQTGYKEYCMDLS